MAQAKASARGPDVAQVIVTDESPRLDLPSPDSGVMTSSHNTMSDIASAERDDTVRHGPDELEPTDRTMTWVRDEAVNIKVEAKGPRSLRPLSVPTAFAATVSRIPDNTAIAVKRGANWTKWTYREYQEAVFTAAKAMIKLGLEPYHGVGIVGFNSPEWFIADLAAIHAGGLAVGIYTTNSAEACEYVAANCEANILIVENDQQLQKILKVRSRLPHLKAIVQYTGELQEAVDKCYTWRQFMAFGADTPDAALQQRLKEQAPNKCCTLIYTSGTTGTPKGVMLSHDNLVWTGSMCIEAASLQFGENVLVSYLPLSHVAAQLLDIYVPILCGGSVYFARPDALKGSLAETLKDVRPTAFLGVPRVWEKMQEKMKELGKNLTGFKKRVSTWAKDVGYRGSVSKMKGGSLPFGWSIANAIVFKNIRKALGLDRCQYCFTGAAPVMKETLDYFFSLDIQLLDLYGMSESTGPHTISLPHLFNSGSVGVEFPGATTKLQGMDNDGNGEICMSGRHVFMGYLNMPEKTQEALDKDGWLHSGDVGKKDDRGFLYITGRIKELLITAGGENVPPVPIEDTVKEELPCISNCMLIGDKKKFLSLLMAFKTEVDPDGMPVDRLSPAAIDWCRSVGSNAETLTEILDTKDAAILKALQEGIDRTNKKSTSNAQKIQKWSILPRDFSILGGELGPTLKLKRPVVAKMYTNTINTFYAE